VLEKVAFYMRAGTQLLWVIDPEMETITSHRPGESPTVHASGGLPASPVLAGFVLDVERLFAILHEGEDDELNA
jgi:Uma2 family endonuclease